jgi:hypothetical protein
MISSEVGQRVRQDTLLKMFPGDAIEQYASEVNPDWESVAAIARLC